MRVVIGKNGDIGIADFSSVQAYKISLKLEEAGIAFYNDLLLKTDDAALRRDLGALIREEKRHGGVFKTLLEKEREKEGDAFEEDDIVSFLKAPVFSPASEDDEAKRMKAAHTAFEEARLLEERSIAFYSRCLASCRDAKAKKAFQTIIAEEKEHLAIVGAWIREKCLKEKKGCIL